MRQRQDGNPLIPAIKAVFYNDLVDVTLEEENISAENIDQIMKTQIQSTIVNILIKSKNVKDCIQLPTDEKITLNNCPTIYIPLVNTLLTIKINFDQLINNEIERIKNNLTGNIKSPVEQMIQKLADQIIEMNQFKVMFPQVKQFILEAKGLADITTPFESIKLDETGVTTKLIRDTFYNEMLNQTIEAVDKGWITKQDLEEQEVYIFLALPALTLIEAVYQSKKYEGIRLLDNKTLTQNNCPTEEDFPELFKPILLKKAEMTARNENELTLIKQMCLAKNAEIPKELLAFKTKNVSECAATFNEIASQISRRRVFKEMVVTVTKTCLENLNATHLRLN
ncbi:MAG: hypothetical protein ACD_46C00039G0008 [uncultured bacterium]|nr:MAG: hypothetical protein ACD_46C00039G0008 [uncultured bacterium]